MASPSLSLLILLSLSLLLPLAAGRHVITFRSAGLRPSSLAWDSSAQHFVVGSAVRPVISAVSDAGVVETLVSESTLPAGAVLPAVAVDPRRRLLLAAALLPSGALLAAAYDLRPPRRRLFLTLLSNHSSPSSIAVNPSAGAAYFAAGQIIHRVDPDGGASPVGHFIEQLAGVGWSLKGECLLAVGRGGTVYRVGEEGAAREVAGGRLPEESAVAVRKDGGLVGAGGGRVRLVEGRDGWGEAGVKGEASAGEGRRRAAGAAAREKGVYLLLTAADGEEEGESWIEEVEWEGEEGEWALGGLLLVGLGLVYFTYWRFQMGRLVSHLNKKTA